MTRRAAILLLLLCTALAAPVQAAFFGREISRRPDMGNVDMTDTVSWYSQESVRLAVEPWRGGQRVEIPDGATAAWVVCDEGGTNWIVRYDATPASNRCVFALGAGEGALPSDHDYAGYVSLLDGTNILGVIDRHTVRVLGQATDGGGEISPEGGCWGSLLERMAEAERDIQGIAGDLAHQAEDIAALEADVAGRLPAEIDSVEGKTWITDANTTFTRGANFGGYVNFDSVPDVEGGNERLATETFAAEAATNAVQEGLESLYAECVGGFRWPDYFEAYWVETGILPGTVTNTFLATQAVCNVLLSTGTVERLKGWRISTKIIRQSDFDAGVEWTPVGGERWQPPTIDPEDLVVDGDEVSFADGASAPDWNGAWARLVGRLGGYEAEVALQYDAARQAVTSAVRVAVGVAPGSLLAACWSNVLGTASNAYAQGRGKALRTWPEGYGSGSNHVAAAWNTNFWAASLGDFSCISYHTDTRPGVPGGCYKPVTMVTPRHGIVANHWKPYVGSNVYFVGMSGVILTNQVVAYENLGWDLTVARMAEAMPTNEVSPAMLLAPGWHMYLYGATNIANFSRTTVPVIGFDFAERGYLMSWCPFALKYGQTGAITDDGSFDLSYGGWDHPYFRREAVGGDSGSPVFWPVDGHLLLLGCFFSPAFGPIPEKRKIDAAIAAWGDDERTQEYDLQSGGWPNPDAPAAPR